MTSDLKQLLSVCLSRSAGRSYMLVLPEGVRQVESVRAVLTAKYGSATHADLRVVEPKKGIIGVDAARDLAAFAEKTSSEGDRTIAILSADCMTRPAANALLKLLEEPSGSLRIILTTDRPHVMPPTIISRMMRFIVPSSQELMLDEISAVDTSGATHADRVKALALTGRNPQSAGRLLASGMLPWLDDVRAWLENPIPIERPDIPSSDERQFDAPMVRHCLQTMLRDTILRRSGYRGPSNDQTPSEIQGLRSWTVSQAWRGFCMLDERAADVDRPTLDVEVRTHALLTELADIRSS